MRTGRLNGLGLTLVELITALVVIAILCTGAAVLITGAAKTNLFVNTQTDATSQAEAAYRRILFNVRAASALSAPSTTTPGTTLTVKTQPDPGNGNATYTVVYTLSGTDLTESDPRYNGAGNSPNVIASNVTAFSVTRQSLTSPTSVLVTITIGSSPPVTRTATILCRNL